MFTDSLIFSQVMEHLPMHIFRRCVQRYYGNHKIISFSCLDQSPALFPVLAPFAVNQAAVLRSGGEDSVGRSAASDSEVDGNGDAVDRHKKSICRCTSFDDVSNVITAITRSYPSPVSISLRPYFRCLRHSLLIRQPFSDRVARTASADRQRQIQ